MNIRILAAVSLIGILSAPIAAYAQAQPVGGAKGQNGELATAPGGPVGAGMMTPEMRPRFKSYVGTQKGSPYTYDRDVVVGAVLPEKGPTYYDVPKEYNIGGYSYTVVNGRTVLVNPKTREIHEIIE